VSKLASKIAATPGPAAKPVKRGPDNRCFPLYGAGDLEDWEALEEYRANTPGKPQRTWREVQAYIDGLAGIETPLPLEKFRYHWRRMCFCWPEDLRR
jgi:hypothetical protein